MYVCLGVCTTTSCFQFHIKYMFFFRIFSTTFCCFEARLQDKHDVFVALVLFWYQQRKRFLLLFTVIFMVKREGEGIEKRGDRVKCTALDLPVWKFLLCFKDFFK